MIPFITLTRHNPFVQKFNLTSEITSVTRRANVYINIKVIKLSRFCFILIKWNVFKYLITFYKNNTFEKYFIKILFKLLIIQNCIL